MQHTEITEEILPVLKAGFVLQKRLIALKAENYLNRLKRLEEKYQMSSRRFVHEFESGNLGDEADWFEWLFIYEGYTKAVEKINMMERYSL